MISKERLVNLATPDSHIVELRTSNPKLHIAVKNQGEGIKHLINSVFPPPPIVHYRGRIVIPGVLSAADDILAHRHHVVMPQDPSGYWTYNWIQLRACYITAKVLASSSELSVDVLVSQDNGTTDFKSLFKPKMNPTLPIGFQTAHNVDWAIDQLYQGDLGRVDILAADGSAADVEVLLIGNYNYTENKVK